MQLSGLIFRAHDVMNIVYIVSLGVSLGFSAPWLVLEVFTSFQPTDRTSLFVATQKRTQHVGTCIRIGPSACFRVLRNFRQYNAFEQAELILQAVLDPAIARRAKKGELGMC